MPPNERVRMHDRQQVPPGHESRQQNKGGTGRVVRAPGSDVALDVARQLLPEKHVLGREARAGLERQSQQSQQVSEQGECVGSRAAIISFGPRRLANAQKLEGIGFLRSTGDCASEEMSEAVYWALSKTSMMMTSSKNWSIRFFVHELDLLSPEVIS